MKKLKEDDMSRTLSLMSTEFQVQNVDSSSFKEEVNADKQPLKQSGYKNDQTKPQSV